VACSSLLDNFVLEGFDALQRGKRKLMMNYVKLGLEISVQICAILAYPVLYYCIPVTNSGGS